GNEMTHQRNAVFVLQHFKRDAFFAQQVLAAQEGLVLSNDDCRDAIKQDGARAHRAGRERGVEYRFPIHAGWLSARIFQRVHFSMENGTALLDSPVVAAPEDAPLMYQYRSNRNA